MNRIRLFALGTILMLALTTVAQQATTSSNGHGGSDGVSAVEAHLKLLTEKLDLTSDQQAKAKPILQEMQAATQKFTQDESMSRDERMDNVRACRYKADREMRKMLSDEQKQKLDQLEQEPHPGLHGNTNGATPPPAPQN
jgi:Spy/CpxP family protein refolding chaperone